MLLRSYLGSIASGASVAELDGYAATIDGLPGGAPVAHWRLGEAGGAQIVDRKAGGRHGAYAGTIGYGATGLPQDSDGAVDFAGTGYGEIPHDAGLALSSFSLSFWFRLNRLPTTEEGRFALISKDLSGAIEGDLTVWVTSDGEVVAQFQSSSAQFPLLLSANIVENTSYHVAVRADSTGFDLLVNLQNAGKRTDFTGAWSSNSQPLRFGTVEWLVLEAGMWPTDAVLLDGVLDEVALYNRILTDSELFTLSQYDTPPLANDDTFTVTEGQTRVLDVAANDTFVGQKVNLTVEVLSQPSFGTATVRPDNDIDFAADDVTQTEQDGFTYRITDSIGQSNVATVSVQVSEAAAPGTGDGLGGDLVYVWQPPLSWIEGVPLSERSFANALNLSRFTDPAATAGSSRLPFFDRVGGGGSTNLVCFTRAPTGHPSMEIKNNDGANSGGIAYDLRFFDRAGSNPKHLRLVCEFRASHPNDPTTYIGEGLFSSLGSYPDWGGSIQGGGKMLLGFHTDGAGASCKYNWYARADFPVTQATWRVGFGQPIGGTAPGHRSLMPLDISWNRPQACEAGPIEPANSEHNRLTTLGERWSRMELELKLCSPDGTPSNATEGNTGFGGSSGTSSDPGPGDGFTKVFINRDIDGELGSSTGRILISHVRGTVTFPRPDVHITQSINDMFLTMWYGGTGSSTYPLYESPIWVRKIELYHYTEDDI